MGGKRNGADSSSGSTWYMDIEHGNDVQSASDRVDDALLDDNEYCNFTAEVQISVQKED